MKPYLFLLVLLISLLAGCNRSALHSDLTVQPGKQFQLGGNQQGTFIVKAFNRGAMPVTLTERRANGQVVELGTFTAGDRQTIRFAAGSAVLVNNYSDKPARLDLTVTGDKGNLTMQERTLEHR